MFAGVFNVANWRNLASMGDDLRHLGAGARTAGRLAGEARTLVLTAIWAAIALSWLALAWMGVSLPPASLGPGGTVVGALPLPEFSGFAANFLRLCLSPATGDATTALRACRV